MPETAPTEDLPAIRAAKPIWKDWYQINFISMPPQTHIHHVHSRPNKVSTETWKQWYAEERSRDMVFFRVSATATFYESYGDFTSYLLTNDEDASKVRDMDFLALYQMGRIIPRYMDEYQQNVRLRSALWDAELGTCFDVATFASDHLELVEVLGSYEHITTVAPYLLHAKIIGDEVEAKLQFDHVNAAAKLDGYRRSLLYRPVSTATKPYVILIHEYEEAPGSVESVRADMEAIEPSKDCAFHLRSFRLLHAEGFEGEGRVPERLER